jgi:predicted nucleic acid-binding protein
VSDRVLVDSSGWIEYFTDSPNAASFAPAIEDPDHLVIPTLIVLEVFRWVLREHGEDAALQAAALMQQGELLDLDVTLALRAAKLGLECRLPLADSIIYAAAQIAGATLWTQDAHFEGLQGVRYLPKPPAAERDRRR